MEGCIHGIWFSALDACRTVGGRLSSHMKCLMGDQIFRQPGTPGGKFFLNLLDLSHIYIDPRAHRKPLKSGGKTWKVIRRTIKFKQLLLWLLRTANSSCYLLWLQLKRKRMGKRILRMIKNIFYWCLVRWNIGFMEVLVNQLPCKIQLPCRQNEGNKK